jgi:signal transduction histidine kinase
MKFNRGIRFQLTAGIVVTTMAGIGLIGVLSIKIVERSALYWKASEAERIVRLVSAALAAPSRGDDAAAALRHTATALRDAGIQSFVLTDASGDVVMRDGVMPRAEGRELRLAGDMRARSVGGGWFSGPGDYLYVSSALAPRKGSPGLAGRLDFIAPLTEINEDLAGVKRFMLLYAVLDSVIIMGFGIYFLSRSITGPIRELDGAATRIAGGALSERANVAVDNEVGSLAASFNVMADRVETEIKTLERVNAELVMTQEELLRSSTLAAVGTLAAGIAHEIGNPLGAVNGYIEILDRGLPDRAAEKDMLKRAGREIARIDSIVREFLDLSRPAKAPPRPVDVNRLVEDAAGAAAMLDDFRGIEVRMNLADGIPGALIDDGKLRQVFLNLLVNAAHALAGVEGERYVAIETGVEARAEDARSRRRRDDRAIAAPEGGEAGRRYVTATFTDNGTGIGEEDRVKVFEPFFTTKDVGRGLGLGLFVAQGIIKAYGGEIRLDSGPGRGASFTVMLPAAEGRG